MFHIFRGIARHNDASKQANQGRECLRTVEIRIILYSTQREYICNFQASDKRGFVPQIEKNGLSRTRTGPEFSGKKKELLSSKLLPFKNQAVDKGGGPHSAGTEAIYPSDTCCSNPRVKNLYDPHHPLTTFNRQIE